MHHELIYLDNAASSWPKPPEVGAAMAAFLSEPTGNPGRGGHRAAVNAGRVIDQARGAIASLVGAESARRIILTHSATDALNTAVYGAVWGALDRGAVRPHVVYTALEHNAVLRPIHELQRRGLIDADMVTCDAMGFVSPDDVLGATNERTVLVAVAHASNVVGAIQPVGEIGARLRRERPGALFLVDASQTVGHIPVDVRGDCIDLLAFPGHKALLGPSGTGALYLSPRAYDEDDPRPLVVGSRQGGTGGNSDNPYMPRELPHQFEAGTLNAVGFAGLLAGMRARERMAGAHERERACVGRVIESLRGLRGVRLLGSPDPSRRVAVVSFTLAGHDAGDVAAALDASFGIAVRAGLQCAPEAHHAMGTDVGPQTGECGARGGGGAVRASPGVFTTDEHLSAFQRALHEIARG